MAESTPTATVFMGFESGQQHSMHAFGEFIRRAAVETFGEEAVTVRFDQPILSRIATGHDRLDKFSYNLDRYILPSLRLPAAAVPLLIISDHADAYAAHLIRHRRLVVCCHDLHPHLMQSGQLEGDPPSTTGALLLRANAAAWRKADRVVCVSEATRRDFLTFIDTDPARVTVIHNPNLIAIDTPVSSGGLIRPEMKALLESGTPFVLATGGGKSLKNHRILPDVLRLLRERHGVVARLAVVGQRDFGPSSVDPFIDVFGRASGAEMRALFGSASVLFFPSLHEGFGLPVIEAQSFGLPVVCSDRGSLPEVGGEGCIIVPPDDLDAAAAAIARAMTDGDERRRLIEAGKRNIARFDVASRTRLYGDLFRSLV